MKIYLLLNIEGFLNLPDYDYVRGKFRGNSVKDIWQAPQVEEYKKKGKKYDFCHVYDNPMFNDKAMKALHDLIKDDVEVLPYLHPKDTYYAINVLNVIDCLDRSMAVLDIDEKYNVVRNINKYTFHEERIEHAIIFKIPENLRSEIFVTDIFKEKVEQAGLTGFRFAEIWDSENEYWPIHDPKAVLFDFFGMPMNYSDAMKLVYEGKAITSRRAIIQMDGEQLYIGNRTLVGDVDWGKPIYIPSGFLEMDWYETHKLKILNTK
ncbi:hypothetical protein HQN90_36925 [Paenibacillus alba]|uniref:imm11 family protein n=1 Tax=Paenibacillus alba TaxID=1197127 RepID=UPI00156620C2|nr:DUF1629 domain-containing protein [Paenibacillus alba]NQX71676.1 hypothetical protein [Paenibacillus alba]